MRENTAKDRWATLDAKRQGLLSRCEAYAALTIPSVCPPQGYDSGNDELQPQLHSFGPQLVSNLVNKMMLACFAPTRPFMKLRVPPRLLAEIQQAYPKMTESKIAEESSIYEKELMAYLDEIQARPKLYDLFTHLIVTGNVCRLMEDKQMRILGIKDFVVRRANNGRVLEVIIKEKVFYDDLPNYAKEACRGKKEDDDELEYFRWFTWDGKYYNERQFIEDVEINNSKHKGRYTPEDMPVSIHTWRLPDKAHYGIGHVEDNIGDFNGLSDLTEAEVNGAILASEFRWLANPGGATSPADIQASQNGDVLPGRGEDLELVSAGAVANAISVVSQSADKFVRRLGSAFLLTSSIQRDAERVTAEEIRVLANELETNLGGVYSRLANDIQLPLAYWLMKNSEAGNGVFDGTTIKPVIVTGLDALSRNGDLENVRLFLADVTTVTALPEEVSQYLKLEPIFQALAAGRGLPSSTYVRTQEEVDEINNQKLERAQQIEMEQAQMKQQIEG